MTPAEREAIDAAIAAQPPHVPPPGVIARVRGPLSLPAQDEPGKDAA